MRMHYLWASVTLLTLNAACKTGGDEAALKGDETMAAAAAPAAQGGGGGNTLTTIMTLSGTVARDVYKKATLTPDAQGTKKHSGNLAVYCTQKGGLPPGAQGFPGVIKYACFARVPLPPGAQGFPAPPFLKLDGTAAAGMWAAFEAPAKWLAQGGYYEKTFESTTGAFSCTKSGNTHACTVTSGTGGGNGGSFLLDMTGTAASSVYTAMNRQPSANGEKRHEGRTAVFCAQQGNLPPGAQGFPGQITYRCSVTQPLPIGAVGFPAVPFLNLEGEAAFAFWEAFKPASTWNGNSSQYEKAFRTETGVFSCAPAGSGHRCTFK